jgi:hypothetical protein
VSTGRSCSQCATTAARVSSPHQSGQSCCTSTHVQQKRSACEAGAVSKELAFAQATSTAAAALASCSCIPLAQSSVTTVVIYQDITLSMLNVPLCCTQVWVTRRTSTWVVPRVVPQGTTPRWCMTRFPPRPCPSC